MKKLRLLFTEDCNRNCKGCCNNNWDLESLPKVTHFNYDEILITGGEPLLHIEELIGLIKAIQIVSKAKIYVYTAQVYPKRQFLEVLNITDGATLTIHTQHDANILFLLNRSLKNIKNKSLKLNVFKNITIPKESKSIWKIKKDKIWIKNCPLPENEEFKTLN